MSMTGSGETMAMVNMEVQCAGVALKYAGKLTKEFLELLKKIALLIRDSHIENLKGKHSMHSVLKHNPNLQPYHIHEDDYEAWKKFCKKNKIPYADLGHSLRKKYGHDFYTIGVPADRVALANEWLKTYAVKSAIDKAGTDKGPEFEKALEEQKKKSFMCSMQDACKHVFQDRSMEQITNDFKELFPDAQIDVERVQKESAFRTKLATVKGKIFHQKDAVRQNKILKESRKIDSLKLTFDANSCLGAEERNGEKFYAFATNDKDCIYISENDVLLTEAFTQGSAEKVEVVLKKDSMINVETFDPATKKYEFSEKKVGDFITTDNTLKKTAKAEAKAEKKAAAVAKKATPLTK